MSFAATWMDVDRDYHIISEMGGFDEFLTPSSNNTREDSTHGHHQMVNTEIRLITFFAAKDGRSSIQSAKTRPEADCGSDHELLIAKFKLKLKKVGKTTRPFSYDLN